MRGRTIVPTVERFIAFNPALKSLKVVVYDEELRVRVDAVLEGEYAGTGRFDSLVVEVGLPVLFDRTSTRAIWPGDDVEDVTNLRNNI